MASLAGTRLVAIKSQPAAEARVLALPFLFRENLTTRVAMNNAPRATISVQGNATVRQRPSRLLMIGSIQTSAATLELALKNLGEKRDAVSRWLERLAAQCVEFGEPRFPDQVEPDPIRMAQQRMRRSLPARAPEDNGKKSVVVSYSALWPIDTMSSDEVLIFSDRLQFEAADLPGSEAESRQAAASPSWSADPVEQMQSLMADMSEPAEGDQAHLLFLSRLNAAQYEEALAPMRSTTHKPKPP